MQRYGEAATRGSVSSDWIAIVCAMHVGIVVLDGYFGSAVAAVVDILRTAEAVRSEVDGSLPELAVEIVAPRQKVTSSGGMSVTATRSLRELEDLDVVVLPALGTIAADTTVAVVESKNGRSVVKHLGQLDPDACHLAAACTGVFLLAETGLLDGRQATTTWFLTPTFRARYPSVSLDLDRMVVADGPTMTAGAAFAHIDLALAILRGISPQLTEQVARLLLVDERVTQSTYFAYSDIAHGDPLVLAFESHIRTHLDQTFNLEAAAQAIGTSRRSLERRTRAVLGLTPLDIVQRLRLERAAHLQRTTNLSTEAIARRVGYASGEPLRALQRRTRKPGPWRTNPHTDDT
jgi:transcriptional regulator GlxA family with amidase domain